MNSTNSTSLTVIGAGPAGMRAAQVAAEAGVEVTLIDNNPLPGGQYYRQSPETFQFQHRNDQFSGRKDAERVFAHFPHEKIRTFYSTSVWGVFDQRTLALENGKESYLLPTNKIILATGAYDRPMAFPGWTLPGVMGAGSALRMIKSQWVLPGKKILVAGSGPLQLALADILIKSGAEVVAIAEAANPFKHIKELPGLWGNWDRVEEAGRYYLNFFQHKVHIYYNHAIIQADGKEQVRGATIAEIDQKGDPIEGTEKHFEVDVVCLGYGLLPPIQSASALGCKLKFDNHIHWFVPEHDTNMETSEAGIYAIGDLTKISGSKAAILEGEIAGLHAAYSLGALSKDNFNEKMPPIQAKLRKINQLTDTLQRLYPFRPELSKLASEDTLICRCEEITVNKVKEAISNGASDINQVKLATRSGMGYCQGRFCSVLIAPLISEMCGTALSELRPFTIRPPFQPLPLNILAFNEEQR
jgi:NADPH-dependent 2,4-dienoyl-CoA reductase/sulfur reductase-like enzyme